MTIFVTTFFLLVKINRERKRKRENKNMIWVWERKLLKKWYKIIVKISFFYLIYINLWS